jgi:membrane protein implicated in regulation of membrane protease activity
MNSVWIWAIVLVVCLVVEVSTPQLVSIWFAAGALLALVFAAVSLPWWAQTIAFVGLSLVLMLTLRKILAKLFKSNNEKTNAESFIGQVFTLLTPIENGQDGTIKIGDVIWKVQTEDQKDYPAGQKVVVIKIKGNKLIVKGE